MIRDNEIASMVVNKYRDSVLAPILPRVDIFFKLATPINNEKKTTLRIIC